MVDPVERRLMRGRGEGDLAQWLDLNSDGAKRGHREIRQRSASLATFSLARLRRGGSACPRNTDLDGATIWSPEAKPAAYAPFYTIHRARRCSHTHMNMTRAPSQSSYSNGEIA